MSDADIENRLLDMGRGKERVGQMERVAWKYIHTTVGEVDAAKSLQSCLTLCDPRDGSQLGSPVPGILQARALEWVAISFSNIDPRGCHSLIY